MKKTGSQTPVSCTKGGMTRRRFVETTAVAGGALAAAPFLGGKAPAYAQARKIHYLQWSSFVPAADVEISRQAAGVHEGHRDRGDGRVHQPERHGGADHRRGRERQRRRRDPDERQPAAPVRRRSGRPQRARRGAARRQVYEWARGAATVDGVARSVPLFNVGNAIVYRKDVFEELGLAVPNTWDEYLEVGRELKNNNLPVGQTLGHTFGDAPTFAYPLMWSFGGQEVDESGKVVINSEGTKKALAFIKEFWEAACDPGGLPGTTPATTAPSSARPSARR